MTAAVIAAVVSIVLSVISGGISTYQIGIQHLNSKVRQAVNQIVNSVNSELSKGRLNVNKLIALLQSKSNNAMMTYLQNNPVISKKLSEIQSSNDVIATLQAAQTSLETEISNMLSQLQQYGYGQSIKQTKSESERGAELYNKLQEKRKEYEKLGSDIEAKDISTIYSARTNTEDLDARSQNIKGGLVK